MTQLESQVESHAKTLTQRGFQAFFEFSQKKMSHKLRYSQNPYPTGVVGCSFCFCDSCILCFFKKRGNVIFCFFVGALSKRSEYEKLKKLHLLFFGRFLRVHESQVLKMPKTPAV